MNKNSTWIFYFVEKLCFVGEEWQSSLKVEVKQNKFQSDFTGLVKLLTNISSSRILPKGQVNSENSLAMVFQLMLKSNFKVNDIDRLPQDEFVMMQNSVLSQNISLTLN
ncbi:hypothetical protein [Mangrovibacterium lignilyticum]|uniref:hypothetical protein n=1 Tax=Mangrovibacterium lignilyticum TaxID=2668052 RepID=UPI0013D18C7A|nr:hypothetical protein [Mangrovibacterium lignilyticum]